MFNHCRHISFIMISTTIKLWSWFNIIGGPRRRSVGISGGETATTARESAVCSNDDGTLDFRIRLFSHYFVFGVTNLLLCSPTSPSGVLCTNGVKTQLQHVKNCLVQLFKNTGCSPPLTSSVAVCHVSASPRPISLLTIGFMALLLVFTRQTSERCSYFQEKPQEYYKHKLLHEGGNQTGRVWLRGGVKQGDPTYIRLFADNLVLLVLLRLSWRWTRATCSQLGFTA